MVRCLTATLALCFTVLAISGSADQQQQSTNLTISTVQDPFDLTDARAALGNKLPTVADAARLEQEAGALWGQGQCEAAVDALDRYARAAEALRNAINRMAQPFYGASSQHRKTVPPTQLAPLRAMAEEYRIKRNKAMVARAECLVKLGQTESAAAEFYQVLGLLSIHETFVWDRARRGLEGLVGVPSQ